MDFPCCLPCTGPLEQHESEAQVDGGGGDIRD
jgi:hypothetical protein